MVLPITQLKNLKLKISLNNYKNSLKTIKIVIDLKCIHYLT